MLYQYCPKNVLLFDTNAGRMLEFLPIGTRRALTWSCLGSCVLREDVQHSTELGVLALFADIDQLALPLVLHRPYNIDSISTPRLQQACYSPPVCSSSFAMFGLEYDTASRSGERPWRSQVLILTPLVSSHAAI